MDSKGSGIKILWVSDLVTPTGFSNVSHPIIKNLEGYDITGVGVNYYGDPHDYKFPIFPAHLGKSVYGEARVCDLLNGLDFDILYILNDAWVIDTYLRAIKQRVTEKKLPKIVVYFPVDSTFHNPHWYENFDIVDRAVTYTQFGRWVVRDANPTLNVDIIPHGVDTDVFYRLNEDRRKSKESFFAPYLEKMGSIDDLFVVINANRNQPRKRLDITMEGFAMFARNKPSGVRLYMHCGLIDASVNIDTLAIRYGIDNRLIVSSTKRGVQVIPASRLNEIYNACDVGINTSMGEGWGLTNMEHAATGALQIVPNHSACREIFTDCGILLDTVTNFMFDNSMTVGKLTTAKEVADKLEWVYNNREQADILARRGYEKLTSKEYTWPHIAKQWDALFRETLNGTSNISEQHT